MFFGTAIAYERGLDFERRVLENLYARAHCRDEHDAAHVTELERALHVHGKKGFFNRESLRLESLNYFFEFLGYDEQPLREGEADWRAYACVFYQFVFAAIAVNDAVAGGFAAGIYPHDAHTFRRCLTCGAGLPALELVAEVRRQPAASISSAGMSKLAATLATSSWSSSDSIKRNTCCAVEPVT